jgi:hypothetical protein
VAPPTLRDRDSSLRGFEVLECVRGFGCAAFVVHGMAGYPSGEEVRRELQRRLLLINHQTKKSKNKQKNSVAALVRKGCAVRFCRATFLPSVSVLWFGIIC